MLAREQAKNQRISLCRYAPDPPAGETGRVSNRRIFPYITSLRSSDKFEVNLGHALRPVGISPQVWRVLATLSDGEGRTIGYIAEATVIDRSNLGRLLEGMAREGLVERMTAPDDRRVSDPVERQGNRTLCSRATDRVGDVRTSPRGRKARTFCDADGNAAPHET